MSESHIDYDRIAGWYDTYVVADYDLAFFLDEIRGIEEPILELTSGTGRLSLPLIEAGADLTCVDISAGMLAVLRRKLEERALVAELVQADICRLDLPPRFALAILPFQSLLEIVGAELQRQALAAVRRCLRPGGRFLVTLHNPAVRRRQVDGVLRLVGSFATEDGGTLVVSGFEQGGRPLVERLQIFESYAPDGTLRRKSLLPMRFELIEREGFEAMAADAGFEVQQLYGSYQRGDFDPATSPVLIYDLLRADDAGL